MNARVLPDQKHLVLINCLYFSLAHKLRKAVLIHNPGAGDESYGQQELLDLMRSAAFDCRYISTKEKKYHTQIDFAYEMPVVAGGDGTLRAFIRKLRKHESLRELRTLALVPLGTSNNISHSLGL